jgi:SAM-dependent methyltransferase
VDDSRPDVPRRVPLSPDDYDRRWSKLAASGQDVHGEAAFVDALLGGRAERILDAGCGTGRVAIELARRGHETVGIDVDADLLAQAHAKAPALEWIEGNLATLPPEVAPGPFSAAVLAGNVMIFVARRTEGAVLTQLASRLAPGGLVVAGFQLSGRLPLAEYDARADAAGLVLQARWSTWDRTPFAPTSDYAVSVHALVSKR